MKTKIITVLLTFSALTASVYAADKYTIDVSHSFIGFRVKHMVIATTKGNFTDYSGTIIYDEANIGNSSVNVTIKSASINTDDEKRDGHLRSADFFDVENHPELTFASKKISKKGEGFVASGDLTMRGVTKQIDVPFTITGKVTDPWGNTRIGVEANLTINRQDYGISWSKTMDAGGLVVGDDVKIELLIEAIQAEELTDKQ